MGFAFAFSNFAHYCVVHLSALLSDWDKKKCVCDGLLFPRNQDPSSLTRGGPVVPLVCSFRRQDSLLEWCKLFANLYELKSHIWFWEEYKVNTLSKFVGYIDLTNFHQVLPKHSRNNEKWKCVRKFWFFTYLSLGVHLHNMPCMFLATPTLDANISTTNQNIEKPDTLSSIDAFWIRLCSHFAYAAACNTQWI